MLGGLLVLALATVCAVVEVLYLPLRAGQVPLPLSVLAAAVLNVAFTRAMYAVTGSILAALLPGLIWLAVVARASIARPEGDLLISGGNSSSVLAVLNLAFLVLGGVALAFAVGTLRGRTRPRWSRLGAANARHSQPTSTARARLGTQAEPLGQPPDTAGMM
ncbi:MAG: hypothetical protein H0T54_05945 [Geodermatophilaceae bacterium]|nr:hypothetical protein [Geodermatophilaceae bacterium]